MKIFLVFILIYCILLIENTFAYDYQFTNIKDCKVVNVNKARSEILPNFNQDDGFDENICQFGSKSNIFWNDLSKKIKSENILTQLHGKMPPVAVPSEVAAIVQKSTPEQSIATKDNIGKYKDEINNKAKEQGVSFLTRRAFINKVKYIARSKVQDISQREKKRYLYDYLSKQLDDSNFAILNNNVQKKNASLNEVFKDLESLFGVERSIMMALWMHETRFGSIMGSTPIISALFTLAFDSPRRALFEGNLITYLKLVDMGHMKIDSIGSWAGAFGQVQFMPQTFMKYAINYSGSKTIDLIKSEPDAMASLSNYLYNLGWKRNGGLMTHVELPNEFDYCLVGLVDSKVKTIQEWKRLGIRLGKSKFGKDYFQDKNRKAWLVIPEKTAVTESGCKPKAFLVYENFARILNWNNDTFFAVTIAVMQTEIEKILQQKKEVAQATDDVL